MYYDDGNLSYAKLPNHTKLKWKLFHWFTSWGLNYQDGGILL